jgi:hypothetical protein
MLIPTRGRNMKSRAIDIIPFRQKDEPTSEVRTARLLAYLGNHQAVVDTFGDRGLLVARCLATLDRKALAQGAVGGARVRVVFEHGDPLRPIVTEIVDGEPADGASPDRGASRSIEADVLVDGQQERTLVLEAREELVLRCGDASITLKRDGTIVVEGSHVESRASETNRITGAQVRIN